MWIKGAKNEIHKKDLKKRKEKDKTKNKNKIKTKKKPDF